MTPRNRSARRTGNANENSQNTSTPTQGSKTNAGASDAYMAAIQTVLAKLACQGNDGKITHISLNRY